MRRLLLCFSCLVYFWAILLSATGNTAVFLTHVLNYWKCCFKTWIYFFKITGISLCCFSRLRNVEKTQIFSNSRKTLIEIFPMDAILQTVWWVLKNFHFHMHLDLSFCKVENPRFFYWTLFKTSLLEIVHQGGIFKKVWCWLTSLSREARLATL